MALIKILPANEADIKLIASLSRQTFYDTFHEQNTAEDMQLFLEKNFDEDVIRKEMNDAGIIFIIAEHEGSPAGYAQLSINTNPFKDDDLKAIEICRLYATKDKIGKGIGKVLMQQCIEIARERGKDIIWLGVWEHNQRAIKFYESQGFKKFDEHVFMLGNDVQNDWLMKRAVSQEQRVGSRE